MALNLSHGDTHNLVEIQLGLGNVSQEQESKSVHRSVAQEIKGNSRLVLDEIICPGLDLGDDVQTSIRVQNTGQSGIIVFKVSVVAELKG